MSVKCSRKYCKNKRGKGRTICNTHHSRDWREKNPIAWLWHMLKKSAKKRNKEFTIEIKHIEELISPELRLLLGKRKISVDRKRNWEGYIPGNLQIMTPLANTNKYWNQDRYIEVRENCPY